MPSPGKHTLKNKSAHQRKNFIHKNEPFQCQQCQAENPAVEKTCRNHCKECLYSLHADLKIPGDRANPCRGLMEPIAITSSRKKGYIITHRCQTCAQSQNNKAAPDDNFDQILKIYKLDVIARSAATKQSRRKIA